MAQAESAALWYALNELDCDTSDYNGGSCTDELQDENSYPVVERIERHGHHITFWIMVRLKGGAPSRESETVNIPTGQVVSVNHRPS